MSELKGKIDFTLFISATNANPNGDPLNGNRPRMNMDGYGEISDVCINIPAIIISIILVLSIISYRQLTKKKLSPILLMVISAVAGVVVYGI